MNIITLPVTFLFLCGCGGGVGEGIRKERGGGGLLSLFVCVESRERKTIWRNNTARVENLLAVCRWPEGMWCILFLSE